MQRMRRVPVAGILGSRQIGVNRDDLGTIDPHRVGPASLPLAAYQLADQNVFAISGVTNELGIAPAELAMGLGDRERLPCNRKVDVRNQDWAIIVCGLGHLLSPFLITRP